MRVYDPARQEVAIMILVLVFLIAEISTALGD